MKIEHLERNLQRQLQWIKAADARLALVLPMATAMLGALAVLAPASGDWTVSEGLFVLLTTCLLLLSTLFSAIAAFPRVRGNKASLVFFGGIAARDFASFAADFSEVSEADYRDDLMLQVHINARIVQRKFLNARRAMACLFLAALPWAVSIYLLYAVRS